jgi:nucleoside-diphosphate-sugar epimerase
LRDYELFKGKTRQYIFISSASAYQKPLLSARVTESTPLKNPYWQYSRHKIECEDALNQLYRLHNFPITIVRPSHTYRNFVPSCFDADYGYTLVNRMLAQKPIVVPGTGLSRWTLTHADDFAKGFVGLMGHPAAIGNAFHITSDEMLTWNQIYNEIGAAVNLVPELVHIPADFIYKTALVYYGPTFNIDNLRGGLEGDKLTNVNFDNSKIKQFVPDYVASIPFHVGIRRIMKWFNADESRKVVNEPGGLFMDYLVEAWLKVRS